MRVVGGKPLIGLKEIFAVIKVLHSGLLAQGDEVLKFEREFSEKFGLGEAIAVNSGTSALHLGMLALGIGPGDEVLVPAFTFAASANAVALTGATPVFIDVDPETFNLDPAKIDASVTPRTKGIVVVHLYGLSANMDAILERARKYKLLVVEDCAQSHGAKYESQFVGSFGDIAAFSFYPTKNMTTGEGGMISCQSPEVARMSRLLRNQGMEKRYHNEVIGFNNRMTNIHAAIGRVQLRRLDKMNSHRQKIAETYKSHLRNVKLPDIPQNRIHVYHQFTIRVSAELRDGLVLHLNNIGIGAGVYYPIPLYRLPSYNLEMSLPTTEMLCQEVVSLPIHPHVSTRKAKRIAEEVNDYLEKAARR